MKQTLRLLCAGVVLVLFSLGLCVNGYAAKVALVTNVDNPDYKNARDSFEQALKKDAAAKSVPVEFVYVDGKGNKDDFVAQVKNIEKDVALIFVAGTPNAVVLKEAGITKPVIFSAVAGPVKAKLVDSLEKPGTNFTGVHCAVPEDRQLKALLLVLPKIKKIGLLYNPADPSVAGQAAKWKGLIVEKGLEAVEFMIPETVNSAATLAEAAQLMVGKVDVIVTTADAKVSPYGEGMITLARDNFIPTYTSLTSLVRKGALVSLGFDFAEGAKLSAPQALDIINGKNPAEIPVVTFPQYKLIINMKTAQKIKVDVPMEAIKTASEIIKE